MDERLIESPRNTKQSTSDTTGIFQSKPKDRTEAFNPSPFLEQPIYYWRYISYCQQSGNISQDLMFSEALSGYHPYLRAPALVLIMSNATVIVLLEPRFLMFLPSLLTHIAPSAGVQGLRLVLMFAKAKPNYEDKSSAENNHVMHSQTKQEYLWIICAPASLPTILESLWHVVFG